MALGVLIEAGSRLAAENARSKANRAEQDLRDQARRELDEQKAQRRAAAEASRRRLEWARFAADDQQLRGYLGGLPFQEMARHWADAAPYADTNPTAATVLSTAEDDLRRRAPGLMDYYDHYREDGLSRHRAMAYAAHDLDRNPRGPARRHGGRPPMAGALTQLGEELDQEITRLAGNLDPIGRARLLRNLEDNGWSAQSLGYIEALLDRAEAEHRTAVATTATPNNPATALDEHRAAQDGAAAAEARAGDNTADATALAAANRPNTAPQVAAQSFPVPAPRALTAHPSATPGAPTARRSQRRHR